MSVYSQDDRDLTEAQRREKARETYQKVLKIIHYQTNDEKPLVPRTTVRQIASTNGLDLEQVDTALRAAVERRELLSWHGQLAVANEGSLVNVIEGEVQADHTRTGLVAQCNKLLAHVRREGGVNPPEDYRHPGRTD